MRALLVFNPNATTTDAGVRDVITSALASRTRLEVHATKQRGHATHIVAGAVHEGVDAVFSLGGDGTANEVLQALAGTDVALGVIPGGGANVFARALGLPNDAVAATSLLLEHLRHGRARTINLGVVEGLADLGHRDARAPVPGTRRYFGFNAGFGFDAAVVRLVEQNTRLKRAVRQLSFVWAAASEWVTGSDRHDPVIEVAVGDGPATGGYAITIASNTDPYTFLGSRAMHVTPDADFSRDLDLLAIRGVRTRTLLAIVAGVFGSGSHVRSPDVDYWRDGGDFTLSSSRPQPLMVDGDYAGEHRCVSLRSVRAALNVIA